MAEIGKTNELTVVKKVDFGVYLDGGDLGEILMPHRYVPGNCRIGDVLEVFIYLDSEDRLIATTERPYAMVGEIALLKVLSITPVGAFLDWGLPKDILAPYSEQKPKMQEGNHISSGCISITVIASPPLRSWISILTGKPAAFGRGRRWNCLYAIRPTLGTRPL